MSITNRFKCKIFIKNRKITVHARVKEGQINFVPINILPFKNNSNF